MHSYYNAENLSCWRNDVGYDKKFAVLVVLARSAEFPVWITLLTRPRWFQSWNIPGRFQTSP
jgi:hypothetical protein